jgi:hypothetical protein
LKKPSMGPRVQPDGCTLSWQVTAFFTGTIFFLQFLPTDLISVALGSNLLKIALWAGMLGTSIFLLAARFRNHGLRVDAPVAFGAILLLALWAILRTAVDFPVYSYRQTLSLVVLCPLAALLGSQVASNKRSFLLTLWGLCCVYFLATCITYASGGLPVLPSGFHVVFDPWPWEDAWYQNTTLFMGIFAAISWFYLGPCQRRMTANIAISAAGLIAIQFLPHLAGRAAILGVLTAAGFCFVASIFLFHRSSNAPRRLRYWAHRTWRPTVFLAMFLLALSDPLGVPRSSNSAGNTLIARRSMNLSDELNASLDSSDEASDEASYKGSFRVRLFKTAVSEWTANPSNFIIGSGPQTFPQAFGRNSEGWYPHNFFLESLCEYGLIGGVLILGPFAVFFRRVFGWLDHDRTSTVSPTPGGIVIAILFGTVASFTGSLSSVWMLVFVIFAAMPPSSRAGLSVARTSTQPVPSNDADEPAENNKSR